MRNGWARTSVTAKMRLRMGGSCSRWFWLAMIMRGSSQQDNTSRGEEIWSTEAQGVRVLPG